MQINVNSFKPTAIKGDIDLSIAESKTITGQLSANASGTFFAGMAVRLDPSVTVAGTPQFIKAEESELAFGFIKRTVKNSSFVSGDVIEVVGQFGPVMWMEAQGTIAPDDSVENTTDDLKVQTLNTGKLRGKAIEYATSGSLVRIMITTPLALTA